MIEYPVLKSSYITTIQAELALNAGYAEVKRANDILHIVCKSCVDNSSYSESNKQSMKSELELIKDSLSQEIDNYYHASNNSVDLAKIEILK